MMKPIEYRGNFIDGRFVPVGANSERALSEDPGDLDHPVGEFSFSEEAVDVALGAARKALPIWSQKSAGERARYLIRFKSALKKRALELAQIISREMGKPCSESRLEVERLIQKVDQARGEELELVRASGHQVGPGVFGRLRFRARGVIAVLAPFNLPAYLSSAQIIPALLAGNTVVFKPSELTPFVGQMIALLWKEAGLRRGVFNLVQGTGRVGRALVNHPGVNGVVFTGSWATGSKIQGELVNHPEKLCALEMGGKNCAIVCSDADLSNAVEETFLGAYLTAGQRCNATSRIAVERRVARKFVDRFLERVDAIRIGYSLDPNAWMGPVVSEHALNRVLDYLTRAAGEGFEALRGGGRTKLDRKGYYLKPSVHLREGFSQVPYRDGCYVDDEIFGPDTAIYIVRNLDEAIRLNNSSRYGLVAGVFTRSKAKYERVLGEAENGIINWNVATTRSSGRLPFGGLKRSGNARPAGFFSPFISTVPTASLERVIKQR